jgi:hypothetical protein
MEAAATANAPQPVFATVGKTTYAERRRALESRRAAARLPRFGASGGIWRYTGGTLTMQALRRLGNSPALVARADQLVFRGLA